MSVARGLRPIAACNRFIKPVPAPSERPAMGKSQPPDEHFEALIEAARAAEPWAVGELWRRYQPRLRGYIGTLEPGAADDICSETWISVGRSLPRFRGAEPDFRSWLFTIAHRRLCDHRRRTGRSQILLAAAGDSDGAEPVCSAESDALEREGTRRALALIAALPPDQAQVVLLRTSPVWTPTEWPPSSASDRARCGCLPTAVCATWPSASTAPAFPCPPTSRPPGGPGRNASALATDSWP